MFTGIVTDIGEVRSILRQGDTRFVIGTKHTVRDIDIGASISCSGVCMTVVKKGRDSEGNWFAVDASTETLSLTTLSQWKTGKHINLERSLKVGDELGGHIVSGHVDGIAKISLVEPEGGSVRITFEVPRELTKFVAYKGSVALDGVSLTVNEVEGVKFGVNMIPHTQSITTFGKAKIGDRVNFEVDVLARYVARFGEQL